MKSSRRILPTMLVLVVGVVAGVILILALLGPSVGNVYSNITSSLRSVSTDGLTYNRLAGDFSESTGRFGDVDTAPAPPVAGETRIILRSASLYLVVADAEESLAAITTLTTEMGGWVVNSSTSLVQTATGQDVVSGSAVVRVPAERLNEALAQIKSGAITVQSETINGQDVTRDYIDLNSQLTNLEAAETQLRELLASATDSNAVLQIFNQLTSTRGQIEQLRGQIQYYDEASAYSSISVTLTPQAVDAPVQIAGWNPGGTAGQALAALVNILRFLGDSIITLVIVGVPLVLIFGLPGLFIYRRVKRQK